MAEDRDRVSTAEVMERNEKLREDVQALTASVDRLDRYGKVNRKLIATLAVLLVLLFADATLTGWTAHKANEAADKAATVQQYQRDTCLSGNEARAAQRQLWGYVIDQSLELNKDTITRKERRTLDALRAKVNSAFADRDCSKVTEPDGR